MKTITQLASQHAGLLAAYDTDANGAALTELLCAVEQQIGHTRSHDLAEMQLKLRVALFNGGDDVSTAPILNSLLADLESLNPATPQLRLAA